MLEGDIGGDDNRAALVAPSAFTRGRSMGTGQISMPLGLVGHLARDRSPKLSAEKGVLPWEPVASEIQPYLSGSREWWLGNLALAQRVDYKNFWAKQKKASGSR